MRWPALSNPNECSWFEPSVAIIFFPTAFLSFLFFVFNRDSIFIALLSNQALVYSKGG